MKRLEHPDFRLERDFLGEASIPAKAFYGIQTLRATQNFSITGVPIGHFQHLIRSLAMVKAAAASANKDLGLLGKEKSEAIVRACQDIIDGDLHDQFTVDLIQGGAGTSTNMNANEVIANRALERLGYRKGDYTHLHPNNDVNRSQSTNDVYPTAVRLAIVFNTKPLIDSIQQLARSFRSKAEEFAGVLKLGRTQLQDAVPMSLQQEFDAFAVTLEEDIRRLEEACALLCEVNLGGTAIGTGINTHPDYAKTAVAWLVKISGTPVVLAQHLVEATSDMGALVQYSGVLKRLGVKLSKICNDLRLLSSGPRTGLGEIHLPPVQPGSSIMPGKVNPVIPEAVNQVAFQVIGNDVAVSFAAEAGQLQLNAMEPLIAYNALNSSRMLTSAIQMLDNRCVQGIRADKERCLEHLERSIGIVTALVPHIGYDNASRLAKSALLTNATVKELVLKEGLMAEDRLTAILSPVSMLGPGN